MNELQKIYNRITDLQDENENLTQRYIVASGDKKKAIREQMRSNFNELFKLTNDEKWKL